MELRQDGGRITRSTAALREDGKTRTDDGMAEGPSCGSSVLENAMTLATSGNVKAWSDGVTLLRSGVTIVAFSHSRH